MYSSEHNNAIEESNQTGINTKTNKMKYVHEKEKNMHRRELHRWQLCAIQRQTYDKLSLRLLRSGSNEDAEKSSIDK